MYTTPETVTPGFTAWEPNLFSLAIFAVLVAFVVAALLTLSAVINRRKAEEEKGLPYFSYAKNGIKVLYCKKDSPGSKMNIEPGDTLISINNANINNEAELKEVLAKYPTYIWIDILKADGRRKTVEYKDYNNGISNLGIIIVPEKANLYFEINKGLPLLKRLKGLIKRQK